MERQPKSEIILSPHVRFAEDWQETLKDNELAARFNDLIGFTQESVSGSDYPWIHDRKEVGMRWQHLVNLLGDAARSHSHPLFRRGQGWCDEERTAQVLEPIDYRSFDASFIENALILTHSLAVQQKQSTSPGLSVSLNILNNMDDMKDPELVDFFTKSFDLRDLAEPTDTLIDEMTLEDFKNLTKEKREGLIDQLFEMAFKTEEYGNGYGWSRPPQKQKYLDERSKLIEYSDLVEYGTAETSEIEQILDERKTAEIARLRQERPDFGKKPDDFESLPDNLKTCVTSMFEYFDHMRERYNVIGIDTHSMNRMGFTNGDLESLKHAGILINEEQSLMPDGYMWSYLLSQPYYECWVSRHYPVESE